MSVELKIVIGIVTLLLVMLSGMPVFVGLGVAGALGAILFVGFEGLFNIGDLVFQSIWHVAFLAAPGFILMGNLFFQHGFGHDLFETVDLWLRRLRGGLIIAFMVVVAAVPIGLLVGLIWFVVWLGRRKEEEGRGSRSRVAAIGPRLAAVALWLAIAAVPIGIAGMVMATMLEGHHRLPGWLPIAAEAFPAAPFILGAVGLTLIELHRESVRSRYFAIAAMGTSCLAGFLVVMLHPISAREVAAVRKGACLSNVKELALAINMYMADSGDRMPLHENWREALVPYGRSEKSLKCPARFDLQLGYDYNTALSGVAYSGLDDPEQIVVVFESDVSRAIATDGPELLPSVPRHYSGDNYGFADGHAQWLPRKKLPDGTWAKEPEADWVIWEPVVKESEGEEHPP